MFARINFNFKISHRLYSGFSFLLLLLTAAIGAMVWQVSSIKQTTDRIVDLRTPTAQASAALINSINASLSNLRGWMLTGNYVFTVGRAQVWNDIATTRSAMDELSSNWTNPDNVAQWQDFKIILDEFAAAQAKVEAIANSVDEQPALKMLVNDAAPQAAIMSKSITGMVDLELSGDAGTFGDRVQFLGMMADVRGTLGLGLANIRAYLLTGDHKFVEKFNKLWAKNERRFTDLGNASNMMSEGQRELFNSFAEARAIFAPIPAVMFDIRGSNQWNMANYTLVSEAAPRAGKLLTILGGEKQEDGTRVGGMIANQRYLLVNDSQQGADNISSLLILQWILLALGIVSGGVITFFTVRAVATPLLSMTNAMLKLSSGDLGVEIPARDRTDEIGDMSGAVQVFKDNAIKQKDGEIELTRHRDLLQTNIDILNTTFGNFPGGISVLSKDLILQVANPAVYQLLDIPEDTFPVGTPYEEIIRYNAERGEYGAGNIDALVSERVELARKFEKHALKRTRPGGKILEIKGWPLPEGGIITTYMDITENEDMLTALEDKSNEAIRMADDLRRAKEAQDQAHQHLVTSINSMRNGFVIWDVDDRLVLANDAYRDLYRPIRDMIVEGVQFEEMMSAGYDSGIWENGELDKKEWVGKQVAHRRSSKEGERELRLTDGRQVVILERVLDNGEVISTIIDVTAHRQREDDLQDAKDQLEKIAYFDTLTGLANRAHCQRDMAEKFTRIDPGKKFAIIQIDLDNFKRVNDTLGHAAGDHLLQVLGERMNLLASEFDNFKSYRWGGDEFIALIDRDTDTDMDAICQELTDIIAIPLQYENSTLRPTVSLGVARYPEDAQDLESLMIFSDLALYKTKELGRDGYQFFTSEMKENLDAEARIEQELRTAIEDDQLELYFQPQLDIDDETITGVEALLRWNHPEKGLIGPGEFLLISETTGLAQHVGCRVFDCAMKAVRNWLDNGLEFGRLAINLSPQHLKKSTILYDFFSTMEKYDIEPHHLAVEFLESFIFDDPNANILDILQQFSARGIHVELDDFGTGYASLSHLSTMPIDGLKIDQSFVHQITDDPRQQGIVASLISMSKMLNLRVVCEGVETWQQVDAIARIGSCSIQGYFIAKPMCLGDITDWIRNERNIGALRAPSDFAKTNGVQLVEPGKSCFRFPLGSTHAPTQFLTRLR